MYGKFSLLILVLYFSAYCKCGLINPVNERIVEPEAHLAETKCREKRQIDENGIKSDTRQPSTTDQAISLIDIENERKLRDETEQESDIGARPNLKTKRCHSKSSLRYIHKPKLIHTLRGPLLLAKRDSKWDNTDLKNCLNCRHNKRCKTSDKCTDCKEFCSYKVGDTEMVSLSNRISSDNKDNIFSKTLYPISTYKEGEVKDIICKLVGLYDRSDIETVTVWVTTYSNNPPKLMEGVVSDLDIISNNKNLKAVQKQPEPNQNSADMKSRFGEYEDFDVESSENQADNLKRNPDIIEGPPPLMRSEINNEDEETPKVGDPSKAIIVQPKEFQDEDVDNDYGNKEYDYVDSIERANEPVTTEPGSELPVAKPSIQSRIQEKTEELNKMLVTGEDQMVNDAQITKIMGAVEELKSMIKKMQGDTVNNVDGKLLGLPPPNSSPSQLHPAVPDHVVDNLRKVNQYLKNRAQDVLDVIQDERDQLRQSPPQDTSILRDQHSDITKSIIGNFKKMPQFVLDTFQDSLDKIQDDATQLQKNNLASVQPDSDGRLVDIEQRFGNKDDNADDDNYQVGVPNIVSSPTEDANVEISTPSSSKKKLGQYFNELKEKQRMYTPKKYTTLGKTRESTEPNLITSRNSDIVEKNPTTSMSDLKNKDKIHLLLNHTTIKPKNTDNMENIVGSRADNILSDKNNEQSTKTLLQSLTTPSKQHFKLPSIPTMPTIKENEAIKPTKLQKYIDKLKLKHVTKNPEDGAADVLTSDTAKTEPEYLAQRSNFNDGASSDATVSKNQENGDAEHGKTYQNYFDKLKAKLTPLEKYKPASRASETRNFPKIASPSEGTLLGDSLKSFNDDSGAIKPTQNSKLLHKYNLSSRLGDVNENNDDKKHILKNKLDDFVAKLKKPLNRNVPTIRSRLNPTTKRILPTKSVEKQKSELNTMVNNLKHLITDKLPKNTEPTVYEIVQGELPNKPQSTMLPTDNIIKAPEPSSFIEDQNDNEVSQLEPTLENRNSFTDETNDWSNSLGKIISESSNPNEVYFIGNGIKLPMKVHRKSDKTLDLTVDIDKLCSCKNTTCSKNSAVIEKTVSEILEKEAELENQLQGNPNLFSRSFDLTGNSLSDSPGRKSEVSKRSPDVTSLNNKLLNDIEDLPENKLTKLPILSNLKDVLNDISNIGSQFKNSLSNTMDEMKNNMDEINKIKTENEIFKNIPTFPSSTRSENSREELTNYLEEMNSDILKKINYNKDLNHFIKNAKLEKLPMFSTVKSPLNHKQTNILEENFHNINNNLKHVQDPFHVGKINSLKNKLDEINNEVGKLNDNNENLLFKSTEKLLGNTKNNIVDKEVNFIKNILWWMKDLTSGTKT